jgi:uridine kinase
VTKPLVIGIAGGTGSGKSTVARRVADALRRSSVAFVDMDAYYRNFAHLPMAERRRVNWDHPDAFDLDLFADHLARLARGEPIEKPVYDFVEHVRAAGTVTVAPADVVVIDGILLFVDPRVREVCDVKVYVDADADVRLVRRLRRDMAHRGRPLDEILEQYLATVRPMHLQFVEPSKRYADVIVPRGGHNAVATEMIVAKIQRRLAARRDAAPPAPRPGPMTPTPHPPVADRLTPPAPGGGAAAGEHVLVVDDEPDIAALVAYHLARTGYRVSTAATGGDALAAAARERPALVVLDLMLPDRSGFDVLERLRADDATRGVAVLMLTARGAEADRIRGLSLGADDYLAKPFSPQELVLRVGAILRRAAAGGAAAAGRRPARRAPGDVLAVGPVRIDRGALTVDVDGRRVDLTPTEYKLLVTLAERRGRVQARSHLLETVWEAAPDIQTRTVDMHVQRLRAKLGAAGELIETVRGFGYRLRAGAEGGAPAR